MSALEAYLSQDRREALARQEPLPDRAVGAVLFVDISGFTRLTEEYTRGLGMRRGAEELTAQLNAVYDALLIEIENFGGSVISFAGDAALCWFAETAAVNARAELRAVACAFALQRGMRQFAAVPLPDHTTTELAIKVAVTWGITRRFLVGDAAIRVMDVLAGSPVTRSGIAEQLARRGEIIIDDAIARALGAQLEIQEWREPLDRAARFAVARALNAPPPASPPRPQAPPLSAEQLKPWLHDAVYKRLSVEDETFLTELRPAVALFGRFQGIDFDADNDAGEKLNQFVTRAQRILDRYGGALLELTFGDKGSYFYAAFGAPRIHEDDARRATLAARELLALCHALDFLAPLQVGISQGIMRVGAYGSRTRRVYGAQGDEVNLAARLMTEAEPGALLVSGRIQKSIADEFDLEPLPPLQLKGKTEPLLPFLVLGARETRVKQLQEAYSALPMIGRVTELALIQSKIAAARRGQGQVISIRAPAGVGKSRLTAEVIRLMRRRRESSYGGECQSFGVNSAYFVWKPILRAFFGVDANLPLRRQIHALETQVAALAPEHSDALPLLGDLLDMPLAENDFTRALEPEFRKNALHTLLRACLATAAEEARASSQALLFVIEDIHWIDPASRDLLQELAANSANWAIIFLLNHRPLETATTLSQIETLPFFTPLALDELDQTQSESLIRAKLAQHAPEAMRDIPHALIERISAQAQGNPFYIEQLLDYIHDRGLDFRNVLDAELELPNTLHRLVLSRLEQLSNAQQLALKAASIIGRWFTLAHLCGYFPALGTMEQTRQDLARLLRFDLIALDQPDPDLAYSFNHVVTHQVAYEAQPYTTRAKMHEAYARFLETQNDAERVLDLLAYHYTHSENLAKQLEYLTRAGQAAAARFANVEAVDYLTRALALTRPDQFAQRHSLLTLRARVFEVQGHYTAQRADLTQLAQLTDAWGESFQALRVSLELGWLAERLSEHETAEQAVQTIRARLQTDALTAPERAQLEIETLLLAGVILWQQGNAAAARPLMEQAEKQSRSDSDVATQTRIQSFLGTVYRELGDLARANECFLRQLQLARAQDNKRYEWASLNNLGLLAKAQDDLAQAKIKFENALRIIHKIGDRAGETMLWFNLANVAIEQGVFAQAQDYVTRAAELVRALAEPRLTRELELLQGEIFRLIGAYADARESTARALTWAIEIGDPINENYARMNLAVIALAQNDLERARAMTLETLPRARAMRRRADEGFLLNTLGAAQLALGELAAARKTFEQARALWDALEASPYSLQTRAGLAELALRQNDLAQAQRECAAIFEFLNAQPNYHGDPAALAALRSCYHVARAAGDPRARAILDDAYAQLQARAEKIADAALRQSFLENVPTNAALTRAWQALNP